jgi:hypothetical protein
MIKHKIIRANDRGSSSANCRKEDTLLLIFSELFPVELYRNAVLVISDLPLMRNEAHPRKCFARVEKSRRQSQIKRIHCKVMSNY